MEAATGWKMEELKKDIAGLKRKIEEEEKEIEALPVGHQERALRLTRLAQLETRLAQLETQKTILMQAQAGAAAQPGAAPPDMLDRIDENVAFISRALPIMFVSLKKQFDPPSCASRGSNEPFCKGLADYYGMRLDTGQLRCMVLDMLLPKRLVCAGHLFAHRHKDYVKLMLGVEDISDARNGLLWSSAIEEAYEYQKICFSHVHSNTFRLHVVDKQLLATKLADYGKDKRDPIFQERMGDMTFDELNGKEVTFTNKDGGGPFKRALAFQAMNALSFYRGQYPDKFDPDKHNFDYMSDFDGKDDFIKAWLMAIPDNSSD